jgi:tRNA (pseudouridine54-N1)-methyltransferase
VRSTPGIYISRMSFKDVLERCAEFSTIVYLKEDGEDIHNLERAIEYTFILSDDKNFSEEEENLVTTYSPKVISLGPHSYHSDHCIVIVNNALDEFL